MITEQNAFHHCNYSLNNYASVYISSFLAGLNIGMFPPFDADPETYFGIVSNKHQETERRTFYCLEYEISRMTKRLLMTQYGLPKEVVYDWTRTFDYALGRERNAYPEYKDIIPHVLPLDWGTIAKFAKDHNEDPNTIPLKDREFKILPKPVVTKDDEFEKIGELEHPTNLFLYLLASNFAGYSVKYEGVPNGWKGTEPALNTYGSTVQEPQREAFFKTVESIKTAQRSYLLSCGIPTLSLLDWHGYGAETDFYPAYADLIKEPAPLDWVGIAKEAQETVLSLYKEKDEGDRTK